MTPYSFIVLWSGITALLFFLVGNSAVRGEIVFSKRKIRVSPIFAVIVAFPLFWITAFRDNVGDTGVYRKGFLDLPSGLSSIPGYIQNIDKDKGFAVFEIIIKTFIGNNDRVYLLILAVIQVGTLYYVYRKYSEDYLLSIFLFIISTDYISWLFNGMRQFLAATIIFASISLMVRKKYIPCIAVILLASTIHASALLMIPVVFVTTGKAFNRKVLFAIVLCLLLIPFIGRLTPVLEGLLENTQYDAMMQDQLWLNDNGTSLFRTAVYSIPAIMSFLFRKYIDIENDDIINLSVNMSVVAAGLYLVSSFSSGVYIGRLPIYASLFSYITLPGVIKIIFTKKSQTLIYGVMIMAYLAFYYYQMTVAWNFKLF